MDREAADLLRQRRTQSAAHLQRERRAQRAAHLQRQSRISANRTCVILSAITFTMVYVGAQLSFYNKHFGEVIDSARAVYRPGKDVTNRMWTKKEMWKYMKEILHNWAIYPGLGQSDGVGLPRFKIISTKEGFCPGVTESNCYGRIDFDTDTFAQVRREKGWLRPNNLHPHCLANVSVESMEPRYVDDAEVDDILSSFCFNCYYPRNGHIVDIPKPVLTGGETLNQYESMCLQHIVQKLTDFFVDESTQLIQLEFMVHNYETDVYILITIAFERVQDDNWWRTLIFEDLYFQGMMSHGNYHGFEDDVQTLIIPLLVSIFSAAIAFAVLQLIQITQLSFLHSLKLFLCLLSFIMGFLQIYWGIQATDHFEEVLDIALNASSPDKQFILSLQDRIIFMRTCQAHLPIANFVTYDRLLRKINYLLPLVFLFQFFLYDDYFLWPVTKTIKSLRLYLERSFNFLVFSFFIIAKLAFLATVVFSNCSRNFSDWPTSLFGIFRFFLHISELFECRPLWAFIILVTISVCKLIFIGKLLSKAMNLNTEVKMREELQRIREEMFDEPEENPLTQENEELLIKFSECLSRQS